MQRKTFLSTASVLVGGLTLIALAPTASAEVTDLAVGPADSFGSSSGYLVGRTYPITATATPGDVIEFSDPAGTFAPDFWRTAGPDGIVHADWTPTEPGDHRIWVVSDHGGDRTITIHVIGGNA